MKKATGFFLALSILLNSGIAAFSAVIPDTGVTPVAVVGNSQTAKLVSSVFGPLRAMDRQARNDNPLVPNMLAYPSSCNNPRGGSEKNIITTTDNRPSNIRQDSGTAQKAPVQGFTAACFVRPEIFPPPGFIACVNCLYLQYFVFLAKSNLPWEIAIALRG